MKKFYFAIFYNNVEEDHPEHVTGYCSTVSGNPLEALKSFMSHADDRDIYAYDLKIFDTRKSFVKEMKHWISKRNYSKYGYPKF